jgi:hypothetical protein
MNHTIVSRQFYKYLAIFLLTPLVTSAEVSTIIVAFALVVQQVTVISGSERLLQARSTILPNHQQAIRESTVLLAANPIEPLTNRLPDCRGLGFAGELRQFFYEPIRFFVLDIEAHALYQSSIAIW